ncbi:U4/U6 small nuclear ribonucleoprotein Prp31 homolog [Silene latifolia]|uniref:U4/U6 small nuclear ribonucleoprotein Prp31 homolog n=1 Tax=Silene latifolia TaxID=37657 RepID=UPI003D78A3C9
MAGQDASNNVEIDPEYEVIVGCNALSVDIEDQIMRTYNLIRDNYRLKFPELESIVHHPIDYARIVKKIGNESDISLVDLEGLLRPPIIMVVSITASTTSGKPLPDDVLHKTLEACDRALDLDSARKKLVDFLETRMFYIAPNLSELVGSGVAAKLMVSAGGLGSLAKMPACNVQLVGAQTNNLAGFSCQYHHHIGYLEQTEIFRSTPPGPALRKRVCRLLAAKSTLVARVDYTRGDPTGKMGRALRQDIHNKIDKWQQLPPPKIVKPLLLPNLVPKKKRGGPRLRKMKERYAVTDLRKLANRMHFGLPQHNNSYQ